MIRKLFVLVSFMTGVIGVPVFAAQEQTIGIYVTPFYNSDGPEVDVGKFSRELAAADKESIRQVTEAMREERGTLSVAAMYVAAIRMYDLGHRDEAVQWFYDAQYRGRLFQGVLDRDRMGGVGSVGFELASAHNAFFQLVGPYINGYAGCDRDKWLAVLESVQAENRQIPDLARIYPSAPFIPVEYWEAKNSELAAGFRSMREYIEANWADFHAERVRNGMDEAFCDATGHL